MKVQAIGDPDVGAALANAVQKVRQNLVGDEESKEIRVSVSWQRPEQGSSVDVRTLALDCLQCVLPECLVGNGGRECAPSTSLAGDCSQSP